MHLLKALSFLRRPNPKQSHDLSPTLQKPLLAHPRCSFAATPVSESSTRSHPEENIGDTRKKKKPLDAYFKETVGLSPRTDERGSESESESEGARSELGVRLKQLKEEVRILESRDNGPNSDAAAPERGRRAAASLYDLYVDGKQEKVKRPPEGVPVIKELSPDAEAFLAHLHKEGYFREANFLKKDGKWDAIRFEDSFSRDFDEKFFVANF